MANLNPINIHAPDTADNNSSIGSAGRCASNKDIGNSNGVSMDEEGSNTAASSIESLIASPTAKRKSPRPKRKSPMSEPNFMCEHCGKSWSSNYKLRNHLRVHTKEKPFKCGECDARFTQKYDCERHERAHYGEVRTYDCEICGRSLASSSSLAKHMTIHTGIKKFKCQRCGKAFPTNGDLTKHVRIHTGEKPYTCDVCGRCFAESSSRNRHRMTHTGEKPHKCPYCFEAFLRPNDLKRHVDRRHTKDNEQTFQDQSPNESDTVSVSIADIRSGKVSLKDGEILLEEVMGEDGEMVYVVVSHEPDRPTQTTDEGKPAERSGNVVTVTLNPNSAKTHTFPESDDVRTDLVMAELINTIDKVQELETLKNVTSGQDMGVEVVKANQAEESDGTSMDEENENSSPGEMSHKKVINYIVPQPRRRALADSAGDRAEQNDPYVFSTGSSEVEAQLVDSQKEMATSQSREASDPEFMCASCDETFVDAKELHEHVQEHLSQPDAKTDEGRKKKKKRKEKPLLVRETHDCPQCDKRYNTQQALVAHMTHHGGTKKDRKFECTTCTWKFPTMYKLTAHMRSHSDVRPFKCPYCEKAYKARGDLRRHVAAHIDPEQAKQYLCSICGAALASTSSLKKHLNIHTGTRNFPCNLCAKSFYSKGDLDKHFRVHTGDKPYKCNVCQRAFAESSTRNSHQRLHSGEKRFECTVCQKRFNRSGDLNRHTRQHTGERRYKCPNCESTFVDSDALSTHKMRFQDPQTGTWQCKKTPVEFSRDGVEINLVSSLFQGDKDIFRQEKLDSAMPNSKAQQNNQTIYQREKVDASVAAYPRNMETGIYVREQDKMDIINLYARDKTDINQAYHDKVDLPQALYDREKAETLNPVMYERDKLDIHDNLYPREIQTVPYAYSRHNSMDFAGNQSVYQRANQMEFGSTFDSYNQRQSMSMSAPMTASGQRVLEMREVDGSGGGGGTYRYGFGSSNSSPTVR